MAKSQLVNHNAVAAWVVHIISNNSNMVFDFDTLEKYASAHNIDITDDAIDALNIVLSSFVFVNRIFRLLVKVLLTGTETVR